MLLYMETHPNLTAEMINENYFDQLDDFVIAMICSKLEQERDFKTLIYLVPAFFSIN